MDMILNRDLTDIKITIETGEYHHCTHEQFMRYLVGKYSNKERFMARVYEPNMKLFQTSLSRDIEGFGQEQVDQMTAIHDRWAEDFDKYQPFTFAEVWEIEDELFQKSVFDTVDIADMITSLDGEKIIAQNVELENKVYDATGNLLEPVTLNNEYEIYRCDATSLNTGLDYMYALKMTCPSTGETHYIWIDESNIENPLAAVSGTFEIHEDVLENMKCLKRQGDILIVELNDDVADDFTPSGRMVRLTEDNYFKSLVAQS